ncbi:hypothetical protein RQP46_002096 [Phenoliferia psychrophenolica]
MSGTAVSRPISPTPVVLTLGVPPTPPPPAGDAAQLALVKLSHNNQASADDGSAKSADSTSHGPPTLLSLPNEIIELVFEQPDIGLLTPLRLVCKRFDLMARRCRDCIMFEHDEAWLDSLFKSGSIGDVRRVWYDPPTLGHITCARTLGLISSLTDLEMNPGLNPETYDLTSPEFDSALAAFFKFARVSEVRNINIYYREQFFSSPSNVPDSLPYLSSVRALTLESADHDVKNQAEAAAVLGALVVFLKLFPNLEQLTLRGWFGKGDSWHKMLSRRLATLPYFDLYVKSQYTDLLLAVVRATPVHLFVARWDNESVRFWRRPGTTEEFERERYSTKMTVHVTRDGT